MGFLSKASGILGMNARNLLYISKYNSYANKKFADDKIFTKNFLSSRGISVAKLYSVIKDYQQLTDVFFDSLPNSFVVKPNRGFAGAGILVIKEKKNDYYITASEKKITKEFLYRHCIEILEGKYSISGLYDKVIFEEKLEVHNDFRILTDIGLPDIRVIVFNLVPVLAMTRIPTFESEGKANMELGAIAMGVDIGTGKTTGAAQYSSFLKRMPNGVSAVDFQIPFWDEMLQTVAKIQSFTKIGFLGCDLVVTKTGVKILEVNARSGLKIQIANKVPLKTRLEKVADLKVLTPNDGVEIAKTLFSKKSNTEETIKFKPVIGILEPVVLNTENPKNLVAKIDLLAEKNKISSRFFSEKEKILDITIQKKRLKLPVEKGSIKGADLILAGKFLTDFYIDPNKKIKNTPELLPESLDEKMIKNIDQKIFEIDEKIKLLSFINPRNLEEQKILFLNHSDFSPQFFYRKFDLDVAYFRGELKKIPQKVNHFLFPLYEKKIEELNNKLSLLESRQSSEFSDFSGKIFGYPTEDVYRSAVNFLKKTMKKMNPEDESEEYDTKKAEMFLNKFLNSYKLNHWKIRIIEETVADIQVTKNNNILLKKNSVFKKNRLQALCVHEIGTHIFRFENGKRQSLRIFEKGTANYLETEEGLAIWNQNQLSLNLGEKFLIPALQVVAIYMGEKMGFRDLFYFLKDTYQVSDELLWKLCVKTKRGTKSPSEKGSFTKDLVYFTGLQRIKKFLKSKGKISDLYVGKIDIEDLELVKKIGDLQEPKFLINVN